MAHDLSSLYPNPKDYKPWHGLDIRKVRRVTNSFRGIPSYTVVLVHVRGPVDLSGENTLKEALKALKKTR